MDGIKSEWDVWAGLVSEFEGSKGKDTGDKLQAVWCSTSWVPIDADGARNGSCVDLKPGKNGTMGQVIDMDHEVGPSGPMFEDYPAYLEDIASELEAGNFRNKDGWLEEVRERNRDL